MRHRSTWHTSQREVQSRRLGSADGTAPSAGASSSRCIRAGPSTRFRSATSPMAFTCQPGTRKPPMRSGPRHAARTVGAAFRKTCAAKWRGCRTICCGRCDAMRGRSSSSAYVLTCGDIFHRAAVRKKSSHWRTATLEPQALTLSFARRFTGYKRPNLLLHDHDRLARLLSDQQKPVQIVLAGKAHPADIEGKQMIQSWLALAQSQALRDRIVFLEDYDLPVAQELTQGVDVWINTPCPPWEACGTSGMKVLVNGGLNLSVRDGWWDEAFAPDLGGRSMAAASMTPTTPNGLAWYWKPRSSPNSTSGMQPGCRGPGWRGSDAAWRNSHRGTAAPGCCGTMSRRRICRQPGRCGGASPIARKWPDRLRHGRIGSSQAGRRCGSVRPR